MSTFNGFIPEISYISVDRFEEQNRNSKMFFLSHCHADHMKGLDSDELRNMLFTNNVFLYTSDISVQILENKYCNFTASLKKLPIGSPYLIKVPSKFGEEEKYLCVTTIPAGHCPGSVMFLFESEGKNILYTGDFRINVKDLHKYNAFHDGAGNVKKLHTMYLDTTFCNFMFEHFPSREDSTTEICRLIEEWIAISERHIIDLALPATYGSEYLLKEIFKRTNNKIHVFQEIFNLYKYMPEMIKIMSTSTNLAKIHTRLNYYKFCCNINRSAYFVRTVKPSAMVWNNLTPSQEIVDESNENFYRVCYSNHASLSEIREFVSYLKPLHIEACVVPDNFDDRKNLCKLLDEMKSKYSFKKNKKKDDGNEHFPVIDITERKYIEITKSKREPDLLSSPPRRCERKRNISEVTDS